MKKFVISFLLVVLSVAAFAQDGLKGKWSTKESMMGLTAYTYLDFQGEASGKVVQKFNLDIAMSMLGMKTTGSSAGSVEGHFTFDGDKIVVDWDVDTYKYAMTKAFETTYKGEKVENDSSSFQEMMDDMAKELEKEIRASKHEVCFDVKISGDKLTFKCKDSEGKTETEKYTRVK